MSTPDEWVRFTALGHAAWSLALEFSYRRDDLFVTYS